MPRTKLQNFESKLVGTLRMVKANSLKQSTRMEDNELKEIALDLARDVRSMILEERRKKL